MEIESTNHQDVAEPDQIASGMAGTGHEYQNKNGTTVKQEGNSSQRRSKNSDEFFFSSRFLHTSQKSKNSDEFFFSSRFLHTSQKSKNSDEFFSSSRLPGTFQTGKTKREIIGLGVLYNGMTNPAIIPDNTNSPGTDSCSDPPESAGDLIFYLYERQERIADRLNKKIERLGRRLTTIEERGRME